MARAHRMTPARRAALRKAQLASARKRRRGGVRKEVGRLGRQSLSTARASGSLARRRAVKNFNSPTNRANRHRRIKRAAKVGVATGVVLGASAGAGALGGYRAINRNIATTGSHRTRSGKTFTRQGGPKFTRVKPHATRAAQPIRSSRALTGTKTRSLGTGPKGKAAIRSRRYRGRQNLKKAGLYRDNETRYG